jgi:hypothetical protein
LLSAVLPTLDGNFRPVHHKKSAFAEKIRPLANLKCSESIFGKKNFLGICPKNLLNFVTSLSLERKSEKNKFFETIGPFQAFFGFSAKNGRKYSRRCHFLSAPFQFCGRISASWKHWLALKHCCKALARLWVRVTKIFLSYPYSLTFLLSSPVPDNSGSFVAKFLRHIFFEYFYIILSRLDDWWPEKRLSGNGEIPPISTELPVRQIAQSLALDTAGLVLGPLCSRLWWTPVADKTYVAILSQPMIT